MSLSMDRPFPFLNLPAEIREQVRLDRHLNCYFVDV